MKFFRYGLSSYVNGVCRFRIIGDFPERFINLCASAGERVHSIARRNGDVYASIVPTRYRRLIPIARRCSVRLSVKERYGLPFLLNKYKKRSGMALGMFLFLGIIYLMSQFVWIVNLPQLPEYTQAELEQTLSELGVGAGTLRSRLNADVLEGELELSSDKIKRAGVSLVGSELTLEIDLMPEMGEILDESTPANLVASRAGVIMSVESLEGQDIVVQGQTVAEGDLLVSGVIESVGGVVSLVNARGSVWARTEHQLTVEIPYTYPDLSRTGKALTVRRLMVFGAELPLFFGSVPSGKYEREISVRALEVFSVKLPFELRTEIWYPLENTVLTITPEYALALAKEKMSEKIASLGEIEIISQSEQIAQSETSVVITADIVAKEDIAVQRVIYVE